MRRALSLIVVFGLLLGLPSFASAHSKVVSSDPADGAKLEQAPAKVTIIFNDELQSEGASVVVTDANGTVVDQGDGGVDLSDTERKTMSVSLKDGLGAGSYTVTWKVVGDDGHEVSGTIGFAVGDAPLPVTQPADDHHDDSPNTMPATGGESLPWWAALGGAALALVGLAVRRRAVRV